MKEKKNLIIGILGFIVIVALMVFAITTNKTYITVNPSGQTTITEKSNLGSYQVIDTYKAVGTASTTGSAVYKAANAATSTSEVISIKNVDTTSPGDLKILITSTSTPPTLLWNYWFTDDDTDSTRNWYAYTGTSDSSDVAETIGGGAKTYSLLYATSTEETAFVARVIPLPKDIPSKYMKIKYRILNAAANVYFEITTKQIN